MAEKLTVFALLMSASLAFAQQRANVDDPAYVLTTELRCASTVIIVKSACEYNKDDNQAYCFAQKFDFAKPASAAAIRTYIFSNARYRDDLGVAVSLTCEPARNRSYVSVQFTNFGNGRECSNCEWEELFDLDGRRLSSSRASRSASEYYRMRRILGLSRENAGSVRIQRYQSR